MTRRAFERWIASPPFEADVERLGPSAAWPGDYRDERVSLAWAAWLAGMTEAAGVARRAFPRAHTYASENADRYRAQDDARDVIVGALVRAVDRGAE
jgi:hypothetical protein